MKELWQIMKPGKLLLNYYYEIQQSNDIRHNLLYNTLIINGL